MNMKIKILENEYWYGIRVGDGIKMPLNHQSVYEVDIDPNQDYNQCVPILLSSKGRYVWCESGFKLECKYGHLDITTKKVWPQFFEGFENLKGAYLNARNRFFHEKEVLPPEEFFINPQFNTWIELMYNQNEKDILNYAANVIEKGYSPSMIMIDDGWSNYYGSWDFNRSKFPEPKKMVKELHGMGFKVMLWTCPFVSPDSVEFKMLRDRKCIVFDKDGKPAIRKWWNGYSAVLDMSNTEAVSWYKNQLDYLINEYGIDGFKFDAGDAMFYRDDDITKGNVVANEQTELWAKFGLNYIYNEYRACFKCSGLPLVQRLADKSHSWGDNGVQSLIPNQLLQGILGYAYTCPDMIGGGEYLNFLENAKNIDEELFVRYAQCSALMPMMQFSAAPWRVLSKETNQLCKDASNLNTNYSDIIISLSKHSAKTGEPIVRYMEYEFPNEGFEEITDQYMLGGTILVAPVLSKGVTMREVKLPKGKWEYLDGVIYEGGKKICIDAPIEVLPYFIRV